MLQLSDKKFFRTNVPLLGLPSPPLPRSPGALWFGPFVLPVFRGSAISSHISFTQMVWIYASVISRSFFSKLRFTYQSVPISIQNLSYHPPVSPQRVEVEKRSKGLRPGRNFLVSYSRHISGQVYRPVNLLVETQGTFTTGFCVGTLSLLIVPLL